MRPPPTAARRDLGLFLAVLLVASALASPPLATGGERRTLDLAHALGEGRLWIDPETRGQTFDRATVEAPLPAALAALGVCAPAGTLARVHVYSGGPPGQAFLLLPAAFLLERAASPALRDLLLVILGAALPHALASVAVRRAAERAAGSWEATSGEVSSWAAGLAYGFGTLALPYGTRLFHHAPALAFLAWGLAVLLRRRAVEGAPRCALAGTLAASAVACDYNFGLAAASLGVLALLVGGVRGGVAFALGTLPPATLVGLYHRACFGSPFETAYHHRADPELKEALAHGYLGFALPRPRTLGLLLVGRRGFLATSPLALVGLAGLIARCRRERWAVFPLGAALLTLLAISGRADWHGGWSFGVRYTLPALPFLALGIPTGLALLGRAARPVAALGVLAAWIGATVDWDFVQSPLALLRAFEILGPRTRAVAALVLGARPLAVTPATSLVAAAVLSAVFVVAHRLARPGSRGRLVPVALALGPFVASIPFQVRTARSGPAAVHEAYRRSYAVAVEASARATDDPLEAAELVGAARGIGDPELTLLVLDRALELDPGNAALGRERAILAHALGRER